MRKEIKWDVGNILKKFDPNIKLEFLLPWLMAEIEKHLPPEPEEKESDPMKDFLSKLRKKVIENVMVEGHEKRLDSLNNRVSTLEAKVFKDSQRMKEQIDKISGPEPENGIKEIIYKEMKCTSFITDEAINERVDKICESLKTFLKEETKPERPMRVGDMISRFDKDTKTLHVKVSTVNHDFTTEWNHAEQLEIEAYNAAKGRE